MVKQKQPDRRQIVTIYKIASMLRMDLRGPRDIVTAQAFQLAKRGANFVQPDERFVIFNDVQGGVPSFQEVLQEIANAKEHWNNKDAVEMMHSLLRIEDMITEIDTYG